MKSDYPAILDACVLLPMPLTDTLLRMAETPRLYLPKWSKHIIEEVRRNLVRQLGKSQDQADRRANVLHLHFPEAWVDGYESVIDQMQNDPKDRHVLAAAVCSNTKLIVTYNAKDFPDAALKPWGIERQGPSTFLMNLYDLSPGIVAQKLSEQAQAIGLPIEDLMRKLRVNVPTFVSFFCEEQRIQI